MGKRHHEKKALNGTQTYGLRVYDSPCLGQLRRCFFLRSSNESPKAVTAPTKLGSASGAELAVRWDDPGEASKGREVEAGDPARGYSMLEDEDVAGDRPLC